MRDGHWYKSARTCLFLHWGLPNGSPAEKFEAMTEGWNAKDWVETAKKLRASYITLANFHSDVNWMITWKTNIPGLNKTKRDFLGELVAEAEKEGIKVVVYITSSPTNDKGERAKNAINHDEYKRYKGDMSLQTEATYADFQGVLAKEVVMELMDNYPNIAGFWFDGWNDYHLCEDTFGEVHKRNPDFINIRNNFYKDAYPNEDVIAQESLGKVYSPSYDCASASWIDYNVPSEWCFNPFGEWYQFGPNPIVPCNIPREIKYLTSILTSGWVPAIGLPPFPSGKFDSFVDDYINAVDAYLEWASPAFFGAKPGGFIGGNWNAGAYGFTTENGDKKYICVTDKPANNKLTLANNSFDVENVINLKTNENVEFTCENGMLSICNSEWSDIVKIGAMIFEVTAKKVGSVKTVNINHDESLPNSIILDVGGSSNLVGLELFETNTSSVTFGSWGGQSPQRPEKYVIYNEDTNEKLFDGIFANQRGKKWIALNNTKAAKLRLELQTGYDTRKVSAAAMWNMGWSQYIDDCISVTANSNNVVQYVNCANEVWERNCGNDTFIMSGIKKVVCGLDDEFYYIDTNDNVMGTEIKADKLAVSAIGEMFYITSDRKLKKNGFDEVIAENVSGIAFDTNGTLYITANHKACRYVNSELVEYKTPYKITSIAPSHYSAISTPSGKVHFVSPGGDNSFVGGYDCLELNNGSNGSQWCVFAPSAGKTNITKIDIITEE